MGYRQNGQPPRKPEAIARAKPFTAKLASSLMAALENGNSLRESLQIAQGHLGYDRWHAHCAAHPVWAKRAKALVEKNSAKGWAVRRANIASKADRGQDTHCARGHEYTKENTRVQQRPNGTFRRRCKKCEVILLLDNGPKLSPEELEWAKAALARNMTWGAICKQVGQGRFYRTYRSNPEFRALCKKTAVVTIARSKVNNAKTKGTKRYNFVRSLLPKTLPDMVRDEVVGMIFEALGAHRYRRSTRKGRAFGLKDVAGHVKLFIGDYYKLHPFKAYGGIDTPWSLNAPVSFDNDTKLIDTVSTGLWESS